VPPVVPQPHRFFLALALVIESLLVVAQPNSNMSRILKRRAKGPGVAFDGFERREVVWR
jgi:hypothetical protein